MFNGVTYEEVHRLGWRDVYTKSVLHNYSNVDVRYPLHFIIYHGDADPDAIQTLIKEKHFQ